MDLRCPRAPPPGRLVVTHHERQLRLAANRFQVNRVAALRRSCAACPSLPYPFVNANVLPGGSVPGEIFGHPVAHELLPGSLMAKGPQRFFDRQQQGFAVVIGKLEAGPLPGTSVPMFDGVVETAGGTDDRD